jgi:peptidoglycan hydrolase CwlO-like protein
MTPNVKPRTVFALAKERRIEKKQSKMPRNKRNIDIQMVQLKKQLKKLMSEKELDRKQIEKLKEELNNLQKKYNQLDDESQPSSSLFRF